MKGDENVDMDQSMPPKVGKDPEVVTCLNCRAQVTTTVDRNLSQNGCIWSVVLWYIIQQVLYLSLRKFQINRANHERMISSLQVVHRLLLLHPVSHGWMP